MSDYFYCTQCHKAHTKLTDREVCEDSHRQMSASDRLLMVSKGQLPLGTKDDKTKPRWSLLPLKTIAQVIQVLEFGATKYNVGNWMSVDDAERRYYDAAMRHLDAWWNGEMNDKESKLPHLAHCVACILFLMWFDGKQAE